MLGFLETQKGDRFWRKNTQPNAGAEADCNGVDLNRNWPYQWVGEDGPSSPCFEMYPGESAGSAPEMKAITSFLTSIKMKQGVKLFVDWHSYSQLVMTRRFNLGTIHWISLTSFSLFLDL